MMWYSSKLLRSPTCRGQGSGIIKVAQQNRTIESFNLSVCWTPMASLQWCLFVYIYMYMYICFSRIVDICSESLVCRSFASFQGMLETF